MVEANGVVTLVADWTRPNAEIERMLEQLGSKQIPVLAIFPAGRPYDVIVLRGMYTQKMVLEKLREAGPSRSRQTAATQATQASAAARP